MEFAKQDGTPSVKVHHAPGGKSNFSLSWDEPTTAPKKAPVQPASQQQQQPASIQSKPATKTTAGYGQKDQQEPAGKTSVKVHNPPGGKSNFTLG